MSLNRVAEASRLKFLARDPDASRLSHFFIRKEGTFRDWLGKMAEKLLSSSEKKELRGIAQRLKPLVHIGKNGLTDAVVGEIDTALDRESLLKVRFEQGRQEMRNLCEKISERLSCEIVGSVGKTAAFYRAKTEV